MPGGYIVRDASVQALAYLYSPLGATHRPQHRTAA
jgi:hypothetical protein